MDQLARMASLDAFKTGDVSLLVCSDVAARGLDIPDVSHVFNFDVPTHSEDYVHRIGRTGRAGRSGTAITLVTDDDTKYIDQIEALIRTKLAWEGAGFDELPPPAESPRDRGRRDRSAGRGERGGRRPSQATEREREAPPSIGRPVRSPRLVEAEAPRAPRNDFSRGRRPRHEDDGPPVIGLGDHVPSFLLRPVVFKTAKAGED